MSKNTAEKEDIKPKLENSSLSEEDFNKLLTAVKKKMQVTVIFTSISAAVITSILMASYRNLQPSTVGPNSTLIPSTELSASTWAINSSLLIMTTENKTFSFDLKSVSQLDSFVGFQKNLLNQFMEDLMKTNRTLNSLQLALTNISEHCDDKAGSLESKLNESLAVLNQSITGQNLKLETLNITVLVVQNTTQLLKIDQVELLKRLIENDDNLQVMIEHLDKLDQTVEQHGQKANKAYDRSLLASAEMGSMGISTSWILSTIVIGLLIELPITLFFMKWLLVNREPNHPAILHEGDPTATVHHNGALASVQKPEVKIQFPVLEDVVTLIGMDGGTLTSCKQLVTRITKDLGIEVKVEFVNEPGDLKKVRGSKVMLQLVDYNQRDVILEEPNLLHGENKVKIADAIIINGVDLFVIYVGHKGSENLPGNNLYDPSLTSVKKHHILKDLSASGRVMSIYKEFSKHQEEQLKAALCKLRR